MPASIRDIIAGIDVRDIVEGAGSYDELRNPDDLNQQPGWWLTGAILDLDFENGRFFHNDQIYTSSAAILAALAGSDGGAAGISIGPYVIPSATEKVASGDFAGVYQVAPITSTQKMPDGGTFVDNGDGTYTITTGANARFYMDDGVLVDGRAYTIEIEVTAISVSAGTVGDGSNVCFGCLVYCNKRLVMVV